VPFTLPATAVDSPPTIVPRDVMILTRSCDIDYGNGLVHLAPLDFFEEAVKTGDRTDIRKYDCFHDVMYLPAERGMPERLANLAAAQLVALEIVRKCTVQARLSYTATQQLQRKLTLHWTGLHISRAEFQPPKDDF